MKLKQPTTTSLVLEALRGSGDFADYAMLVALTGRTKDQLIATCHDLRRYRAIDVVINPDGHAWWFALPAEEDRRSKTISEIVVGITRKRPSRKK